MNPGDQSYAAECKFPEEERDPTCGKSQRVVGITSLTYVGKVQETRGVREVTKCSGARFPPSECYFPAEEPNPDF